MKIARIAPLTYTPGQLEYFSFIRSGAGAEYHQNPAFYQFPNGDLLMYWYTYDFDECSNNGILLYSISRDRGLTWSDPQVYLADYPGGIPYFRLLRLHGGEKTLMFLTKTIMDELEVDEERRVAATGSNYFQSRTRVFLRRSTDGGRSFDQGEEIPYLEISGGKALPHVGFYGSVDDLIQLQSGRILAVFMFMDPSRSDAATGYQHYTVACLLSDDGGGTWRRSGEIRVDTPRGVMEVQIVETAPNHLFGLFRTKGGYLYQTVSDDGGETWSASKPSPLPSPESMARMIKLQSGNLLVVWNNVSSTTQQPRHPLVAAISEDGGGSWSKPRLLQSSESAQVDWSAGPFHLARTVTVRDDHVTVSDAITNTGPDLAGLILHHRATAAAPPDAVYIGGVKVSSGLGRVRSPANPSVFARYGPVGLGVVAEDDMLRLHALGTSEADGIGLTDDRLALDGGQSVTLEWSLYPVPDGDYWNFVNAVRRAWGANFAIPGPFVFNSAFQPGQPAEYYAEWVRARSLKYVCGGIAQYPDGTYAHGTGILFAPQWVAHEKEWTRQLRAAAPEVTPIQYFHAQICTEPDGVRKYADSRLLDEKGRPVNYPYDTLLPAYVPTRENAYGQALWGYVNTLVDEIGVGGVYWDEQAYSVDLFHYGEPWDGVTALIDPETHAVVRKISCVTLLMQPLQRDIIHYLRDKGLFLMGNGQAHTRTIQQEKMVFFTECQTYSALARGHLGTPLGLGNHHPEDSVSASARHVRDMLRHGSVYYGHYYHHAPAAWNFTTVMYPITPVELHEGCVLGAERIHTAVSGRFGWPDGAAAEVYVVNAEGTRVEPSPVREVVEDGQRRYEIRMPGDHFAILVRRDAAGAK